MVRSATFHHALSPQSAAKAAMVAEYFASWARRAAAAHPGPVNYVDLFAGPGRYDDGEPSTPLLVVEAIVRDPYLRERVRTFFNDHSARHARVLRSALAGVPGVSALRYPPEVLDTSVTAATADALDALTHAPTLTFIDSHGYAGLAARIVEAATRTERCECIVFVHTNRLVAAVHGSRFEPYMVSFFGQQGLSDLREVLAVTETAPAREAALLEGVAQRLKELANTPHALPFRFVHAHAKRTTHHLVFVAKRFDGYDAMKHILAKRSSAHVDGVPSFEYVPGGPDRALLFALARARPRFVDALQDIYSGRTLTLDALYRDHSVATPYVRHNYVDALRDLEDAGRVVVTRGIGAQEREYEGPTSITFVADGTHGW